MIGFSVGLVFFFFLLTLQKITLSNIGEVFFSQKFCSFYEVYVRNFKLIRSLLVIRFSIILRSTRWAYLPVYYHK